MSAATRAAYDVAKFAFDAARDAHAASEAAQSAANAFDVAKRNATDIYLKSSAAVRSEHDNAIKSAQIAYDAAIISVTP